MDWIDQSDRELLHAFAGLMAEMRRRGMIRSSNNPVADYTERLVAQRLGLELRSNSASGFDAADRQGLRYQIKGRRLTPANQSTQLSALRSLAARPFDYLAGVVYHPDFSVAYAALVPFETVLAHSSYRAHTNGHVFMMKRSVLQLPGVQDITSQVANQ